jgi:hypothetical protein
MVLERQDRPARPADARPGGLWALSLLGAAVALGAIAAMLLGVGEGSSEVPAGPEGTRSIEVGSREHSEDPVAYDLQPPAGGDHAPVWVNCGSYDTAVPPELAVHAMEHGAVWVTYRDGTDAGDVSALRETVEARYVGRERYVVLSPYEQEESVVLSTWGRQLRLDDVRDPRIGDFLRQFAGGSQSPEPQFPCTEGLGEPIG